MKLLTLKNQLKFWVWDVTSRIVHWLKHFGELKNYNSLNLILSFRRWLLYFYWALVVLVISRFLPWWRKGWILCNCSSNPSQRTISFQDCTDLRFIYSWHSYLTGLTPLQFEMPYSPCHSCSHFLKGQRGAGEFKEKQKPLWPQKVKKFPC